jgi:hypothetical protein
VKTVSEVRCSCTFRVRTWYQYGDFQLLAVGDTREGKLAIVVACLYVRDARNRDALNGLLEVGNKSLAWHIAVMQRW